MVVNEIEVVYCMVTVCCIILFQFLRCRRKCDGGGLKKNEGTCTYGVVLVDLVVDYMVSDGEMVE